MLAPLICLLGLTLVGQDGPTVSAATPRWALDLLLDEPSGEDWRRPRNASLDDEVENFPDEPEGDDEEDPGEAMGSKGTSGASGLAAALTTAAFFTPPPPPSALCAPSVRADGSPLSLLCRLRI